MTPAERIAAALDAWHKACSVGRGRAETAWPEPDAWILDALCPKGERVVLDRTGDTDRLVKQESRVRVISDGRIVPVWVDEDAEDAEDGVS